MTDEPFGPIAAVTPFKDFDEVVRRANSLQYGLAAFASHYVIEKLRMRYRTLRCRDGQYQSPSE